MGSRKEHQQELLLCEYTQPRLGVPSMKNQEMKKDSGKDRWDLLPLDCIEGMIQVLTFGAAKYKDNGWKELMRDDPEAVNRVRASFRRHQLAIDKHGLTALDLNKMGGVDKDHSGLPHIAHVMCNVMFLEFARQLQVEKEAEDAPPSMEDLEAEALRLSKRLLVFMGKNPKHNQGSLVSNFIGHRADPVFWKYVDNSNVPQVVGILDRFLELRAMGCWKTN